jgi:LemA protein
VSSAVVSSAVLIGVIAALVIFFVLVGWVIAVYNRLVRARNGSQEALRGIDVALETRFDQVKAQADAASGIVAKEVEMVLGATALRTGRSIRDLSVGEKAELNASMDQAQQMVVEHARTSPPGAVASIEAYPEMQTHQNVELLQRTINETEERLQAARRVYNRAATDYNTKRQVFPTVLIAGLLGFKEHELFELTHASKRGPHDLEGFLK